VVDLSDRSAASGAAVDPTTSAADLARIAQHHPDLRVLVATHPNAYPALLDWLSGLGDPAVAQAVVARRSGFGNSAESITFVSAPPPPPSAPAVRTPASDAPRSGLPPLGQPWWRPGRGGAHGSRWIWHPGGWELVRLDVGHRSHRS